jgi:hypothetical protein
MLKINRLVLKKCSHKCPQKIIICQILNAKKKWDKYAAMVLSTGTRWRVMMMVGNRRWMVQNLKKSALIPIVVKKTIMDGYF